MRDFIPDFVERLLSIVASSLSEFADRENADIISAREKQDFLFIISAFNNATELDSPS